MNEAETITILENLLQRWALHEPDRCRSDNGISAFLIQDSFWTPAAEPTECDWAMVQYAVQKAIHDRQWRFRVTDVSNHLNPSNKLTVYEIDVMDHDFEYLSEGEYTDPSLGLLDSYVDALECFCEDKE